jgi:hypothetical protein
VNEEILKVLPETTGLFHGAEVHLLGQARARQKKTVILGGYKNDRIFAANNINYIYNDTSFRKQSSYFPNQYSTPEARRK